MEDTPEKNPQAFQDLKLTKGGRRSTKRSRKGCWITWTVAKVWKCM